MRITRHPGRKLVAIYLGGVAGALIRVGLAEAFPPAAGAWPWPTFAVNMAGALLLGWFFARLRDHGEDRLVQPLLGTGLCGTLTTFSTFQLELFHFVDAGETGLALAYCAVTVALGYVFVRLGIGLERMTPGSRTPARPLAEEEAG